MAGPLFPPFHHQGKRAKIEAGPARFAAVAVPAIGFENRDDVALEGGTGVLVRTGKIASAESRQPISMSQLSVCTTREPRSAPEVPGKEWAWQGPNSSEQAGVDWG